MQEDVGGPQGEQRETKGGPKGGPNGDHRGTAWGPSGDERHENQEIPETIESP